MKTILDKMTEKGFRPFTSSDWCSYAAAEGNAMIMSRDNYDWVYSEPKENEGSPIVMCQFCVNCDDFPMCGFFHLNNPTAIDYTGIMEDIDAVIKDSPLTHCIALENSLEEMLKTTYGVELIC